MCGAKLGDICLLKAHRGHGEDASNYTQYAKCPHSPGGNIRGGKSNEFNKPGDKEWSKKQDPALRLFTGLYWVTAIRAHRSGANNAVFRQRELIPLRSAICWTGAQIARRPHVFAAPWTIQFRPHVV